MLSDYELQRLETIAQNQAKLSALGLAPGEGLVPAAHEVKAADGAGKKKRRAPPAPPASPQRRSSRVRREPAPRLYVEAEEEASGKVRLGGADAARVQAAVEEEAAHDFDPDEMPSSPSMLTDGEKEVYEIIREARNAKARSLQRSMFIVCQNRTMCEMVRTLPSTKEELRELYGMGGPDGLKVARYGDLLLDALRPHADRLRAEHEADAIARAEAAAAAEGAPPAVVVD